MTMFQFAGDVEGRTRKPVTRYGTKESGMTTEVGGWRGMIRTTVYYCKDKERDMFRVSLIPHWSGSSKPPVVIAEGVLDHKVEQPFTPAPFIWA